VRGNFACCARNAAGFRVVRAPEVVGRRPIAVPPKFPGTTYTRGFRTRNSIARRGCEIQQKLHISASLTTWSRGRLRRRLDDKVPAPVQSPPPGRGSHNVAARVPAGPRLPCRVNKVTINRGVPGAGMAQGGSDAEILPTRDRVPHTFSGKQNVTIATANDLANVVNCDVRDLLTPLKKPVSGR
jgi:hypothetical protein